MNEEEIVLLSDDEKIKWISEKIYEITSEEVKRIIITFKSDEKKIKVMKRFLRNCSWLWLEIIESLSSIDYMLDCANMLETRDKNELLRDIVLENDEQRFKAVKIAIEIRNFMIIPKILKDMSKENIARAVDLIENEQYKARVIADLQNEEMKIELLKSINDEYCKTIVICSLKDENKIVELEKLKKEFSKAIVIASLKEENEKIKQLSKLSDEGSRKYIIISIKDDLVKIEQLKTLKNENDRAMAMASLNDDIKKIEQLKELKDEENKTIVIISLKNTERKLEQLELLKDEKNKAEIIASLWDEDEVKIEQMQKLKDEYAKAIVICSLDDDDKKAEQLEKLSDEIYKAMVISSFYYSSKREKQIEKLSSEYLKVLLRGISKDCGLNNPIEESLISRNKLRELFLNESRKYAQIGLDKKLTIGMEIESEGPLSIMMLDIQKILTKRDGKETRNWESKIDTSLKNGVEIVSPILSDNKDDVEDIYTICAMLQKTKQQISERCGGHIHIGADYLTSKEAYINLFEIWGNSEKILYIISNEKGTIPRRNILEQASTISPKYNEAIEKGTVNIENEDDLDTFINDIKAIQGENRHFGLNLLNIHNGKNTIEFRAPNGTINPDTWIENARLFGRIVQISQKLADIERKTEKSSKDEKLLKLKELLKKEMPEQEKMEVLLELLFTEEERNVYRERYIFNTKLLEQLEEANPLNTAEFSSVDSKNNKHSIDEYYEVAINEKSGPTNETTRETREEVTGDGQLELLNDNNHEV